MENNKTVKKNIGLQTIYQILNTCLPLITGPYLSRILGASQLGVFSYTSSVVSYFALFAMLGTTNYGTRSISFVRSDKYKRSQTFWSIYVLQVILSIVVALLYIFYLFVFCKDNRLIAALQGITIIYCTFDINWFFFGIEEFKITVSRSMIIRIATVVLIILLVKTEEDLWIYVVLLLGGTLISNIVLFIFLPRYVSLVKISINDVLDHFRPNLSLFIPLLAMSIYHIMDKTMLGLLSTYSQTGFYYNADKMINIPAGIISGISTVMLPRITTFVGTGEKNIADELFKRSLEGTIIIATSLSLGIAAIAKEFEPIFFGPGYDECIRLTIVLSPVLIIKAFSNSTRFQFLIPNKREKEYSVSVIIGSVVNLVFNFILIPQLGAMGAVIGTLLAEFTVCLIQFRYIRNYVSLKDTLHNCLGYIVIGFIMFFLVRCISELLFCNIYIKLVIQVIIGAFIYISLTILYMKKTRNPLLDFFAFNFKIKY